MNNFTGLIAPPFLQGWYSVRREMKKTMIAFLFVGFAGLTCWSVMYYSEVFRWTWLQWPFFACFVIISQVVLIASIILGIMCWRNFHKGLAQFCKCFIYLLWSRGFNATFVVYADDMLTGVDFEPEVFEHKPNGDIEKHTYVIDLKNAERDNAWNSLPKLKKRQEL